MEIENAWIASQVVDHPELLFIVVWLIFRRARKREPARSHLRMSMPTLASFRSLSWREPSAPLLTVFMLTYVIVDVFKVRILMHCAVFGSEWHQDGDR